VPPTPRYAETPGATPPVSRQRSAGASDPNDSAHQDEWERHSGRRPVRAEMRMAHLIEPFRKKRKPPVERLAAKWHQNDARTFILETQDESFNERDTPVLANGAEARCDSLAITPILEHAAPELLALVADDVFRGGTSGVNGAFEEVRNRYGRIRGWVAVLPEFVKLHLGYTSPTCCYRSVTRRRVKTSTKDVGEGMSNQHSTSSSIIPEYLQGRNSGVLKQIPD